MWTMSTENDLNYDHEELQEYHFQSVTRTNVLPHDRNLSLPPCKAINDHKVNNPNLRTYLTLSESDKITFSDIVEDSHRKRQFLTSCPFNLRLWGFDGLILRWVYPPQPEYLTQLLEELRNSFFLDYRSQKKGRQRLLLGVILTGETGVATNWYEVDAVSDLVDFIVLQLFDSDPPAIANVTTVVSYLYKPQKGQNDKTEDINNITDLNASNITEGNGNFNSWQPPNPLTQQINNHMNPNDIFPREIRAWVSADESNAYKREIFEEALETDSLASQLVASLSKPKVFCIDETIKEWTLHGADKSKLIIGLSLVSTHKQTNLCFKEKVGEDGKVISVTLWCMDGRADDRPSYFQTDRDESDVLQGTC